MLKSHEKFHSVNGKRQVLVVDDEMINRALMEQMLAKDYEVIFAENGKEALDMMRANKETLSLVLLDILMPVMTGIDVLKEVRKDPEISRIPIIMITSDETAEVESLNLGAIDFISKPYPNVDIVLARVSRTIEFSEDRDILQSTEREALTGLYNREFFYRYGEQYDQFHKDIDTDAVIININHFRLINERYGKAYGDDVLRRIGEIVRGMVKDSGGIVSRQEADNFMVYCPHREDYETILENASSVLSGESGMGGRVRLRMGIYENVDKNLDIERRFDRAKLAADTVRNNYMSSIARYDIRLHENELYTQKLLEDFQDALEQRQFVVYFQPKFDIRMDKPVLNSAEALVRWNHPEHGMISPGIFIPLFEENGLIQQLDRYVWREAASKIKDWKDRLGISVPVSVNVSRIDLYDPGLIPALKSIIEDYQLESDELMLEITESAYTNDSAQIVDTVNKLRNLGFRIEMDDFGTGYSSLNMISSMPIDVLKLDMEFIRDAFREGGDTRMIEVIIDIADYLGVPVIAEGVETEEQLDTLRSKGCDIVQGYYFSRPVPAERYEEFIIEKKKFISESDELNEVLLGREFRVPEHALPGTIARALSSGFDVVYYVDINNDHYVQFSVQGRYEDLHIETSGTDFFGDTQRNLLRVVYEEDQSAVSMALEKDILLSRLVGSQTFTMTYRLMIDNKPMFFNLMAVRALSRDDHHIVIGVRNVHAQVLRGLHMQESGQNQEYERIKDDKTTYSRIAKALSKDYYSIYLVNIETDEFIEYSSSADYQELQVEQSGVDFFSDCRRNVMRLVYKDDLEKALSVWDKERLIPELKEGKTFSSTYRLMFDKQPVYINCKVILMDDEDDKKHIVIGVSNVDDQMKREKEMALIQEKANRDAMTGVKSKHAYVEDIEKINFEIDENKTRPFSVVVCDVNGLKQVNDSQGHQAGDNLIMDASHIICEIFKHSPVYRIGGDEFVAILRGQDYEQKEALLERMKESSIQNKKSGGVVIACGMSTWNENRDAGYENVFERADAEMYKDKAEIKAS